MNLKLQKEPNCKTKIATSEVKNSVDKQQQLRDYKTKDQ